MISLNLPFFSPEGVQSFLQLLLLLQQNCLVVQVKHYLWVRRLPELQLLMR
jgi:hypothetical protein